MAWSPTRRANAGVDGVGQSGDYATLNSNPPRDGTERPIALECQMFDHLGVQVRLDHDKPPPAVG